MAVLSPRVLVEGLDVNSSEFGLLRDLMGRLKTRLLAGTVPGAEFTDRPWTCPASSMDSAPFRMFST